MLNESRVESRMLAILSEHDLDGRPIDALRVPGLGRTVVAATGQCLHRSTRSGDDAARPRCSRGQCDWSGSAGAFRQSRSLQ